MKANLLVVAACMSLIGTAAFAQRSGTGVGFIVGEPTGLSLKHWLTADRAVDAAAAWSLERNNSVQLHADYLIHNFDAMKQEAPGNVPAVYYGLGVRLRLNEDNGPRHDKETTFGARIPVGLDFFLTGTPVDVFVELVPVVELAPSTDLDLDAALGVRYFFR